MKKLIGSLLIILTVGFVLYFNFDSINETAENNLTAPKEEKIEPLQVTSDKVFELGFDQGINDILLNSDSIYVIDSNNRVIKTTIKKINDQLINILPPKSGYEEGESYRLFINRDLDLENVHNEKLPDEYEIAFEINSKT